MRKLIAMIAAVATSATLPALASTIDLSTITEDTTLDNGDVVTGTLDRTADWSFYKLAIADGATVTLRNATVNPRNYGGSDYSWPAIDCKGSATIILEGENNVTGLYDAYPAIYVPNNKKLTIKGTGSLTVDAHGSSAAIGSGNGSGTAQLCGSISIEGGMIKATGGYNGGAGIGSGAEGVQNGSIVISGGNVEASGGSNAAGIGSGYNGTAGAITIKSGIIKVKAKSMLSSGAIGSGGGSSASCGTVTVENGLTSSQSGSTHDGYTRTIAPTAVTLSSLTENKQLVNGDTVTGTLANNVKITIAAGATVRLLNATINGTSSATYDWAGITCLGSATIILEGENTVKGFKHTQPGIFVPNGYELVFCGSGSRDVSSNGDAAGIGAGANYNSISGDDCGYITIKGGTITAKGGYYCAGIGCGNGYCGGITLDGGTVLATGGYYAAGIGSGYKGACGTITVRDNIDVVKATAGYNAEPIGAGYNGRSGEVYVDDGLGDNTMGNTRTIAKWVSCDVSSISSDTVFGDGSVITGTYNGTDKLSIAAGATVTLSNANITAGKDTGTLIDSYGGLTCLGNATILLEGDSIVRSAESSFPAIHSSTNATLTIKGSTGSLKAYGGFNAAGIGSGSQQNAACGNIVIDGGKITAYGGILGAGIGSGSGSTCGTITINGGMVKSFGGGNYIVGGGAGIGSGHGASCGNIYINGGDVTATGAEGSAGIGSGGAGDYKGSTCGRITIRTGISRVVATCGDNCNNPIGKGKDSESYTSTCGTVSVPRSLDDETIGKTRTIKSKAIDLAYIEDDYEAQDGDVLNGTTGYSVTIPSGATVTINGVAVTAPEGGTVLPAPA
ncbi:MAG: hypothetical protein II840_06775, partial [Kiritimatiellae bacterium]|nr:hypothetical protein [Kiritimatiellia bacterium]